MKNKDIIVVGIQPYDIRIGSNCKNIADVLARDNRVLYVNFPLDRKRKFVKRKREDVQYRIGVIKGKNEKLVKVGTTMWNLFPDYLGEPYNWIPIKSLHRWANKRESKRFAACIQEAIDELGFKDFIIINDSLMFLGYYLKELLNPKAYLYYIRDNLVSQPHFRKHGLEMEPELIAKVDAVVSNSVYLANYAKPYNPNSYMTGQGCDVTLFNDDDGTMPLPDDIKDIPKPIIGYVGWMVAIRLDIEVIAHMAKARKDWSIVLVGPEDEGFQNSELHNIDNVYFLGRKKGDELPNYIKGFDVCINPQLVNDMTIGNYPRKIDEYLSMGKPTLATPTEAMEYFAEYTYLAPTKEDYVKLAEKALAEDSPEKQEARKVFARSHTWENNVKNITDVIEKIIAS